MGPRKNASLTMPLHSNSLNNERNGSPDWLSGGPYHHKTYIRRKKKVNTLPEWPEIRIFYFDTSRMDLGVTEVRDGDNCFHIFDIEKTVVDIIYYRNKIGIEETSEVLRNYLKRRDRQIDRLYSYAKRLRCEKIVRTYLEVLV